MPCPPPELQLASRPITPPQLPQATTEWNAQLPFQTPNPQPPQTPAAAFLPTSPKQPPRTATWISSCTAWVWALWPTWSPTCATARSRTGAAATSGRRCSSRTLPTQGRRCGRAWGRAGGREGVLGEAGLEGVCGRASAGLGGVCGHASAGLEGVCDLAAMYDGRWRSGWIVLVAETCAAQLAQAPCQLRAGLCPNDRWHLTSRGGPIPHPDFGSRSGRLSAPLTTMMTWPYWWATRSASRCVGADLRKEMATGCGQVKGAVWAALLERPR